MGAIKKFFVVSKIYFKYLLSYKILFFILIANIFSFVLSYIFSKLGLFDISKIFGELLLGFSEIFGIIFSIILINILFYETKKKDDELLIAKGISTKLIFLSKIFTTKIALFIYFLILGILGILGGMKIIFLYSTLILFLKILIFTILTIFLSTYFSFFVTILTTLTLYFIGHMIPFLLYYTTGISKIIFNFIQKIIPAFYLYSKDFSFTKILSDFLIYSITYIFLSKDFWGK